MDDLSQAFSRYTDSVVTTSNLTLRRDLMKEKSVKQQSMRDRWQKHYHSFVALAEDHDRASEKTASALDYSNDRIKQNGEVQANAVKDLLSSMSTNVGVAPLRKSGDKIMSREVSDLKADLRDMNSVLVNVRHEGNKITQLESKQIDLDRRICDLKANAISRVAMTEYESKLAQLTVNLSKLQASFNQQEKMASKPSETQSSVEKLGIMELNINKSMKENLKNAETLAEVEKRLSTLNENVIDQKENFEYMKLEITGDPKKGDKGWIDYITEGVKKNENLEKAVKSLDTEVDGLTDKVQKLEIELSTVNSKSQDAHRFASQLGVDFEGLTTTVHKLETEVNVITSKQQELNQTSLGLSMERDHFMQRLQQLETSVAAITSRSPDPKGISSESNQSPDDSGTSMKEALASLEEKFASLENQLEDKDNMVLVEVERLDKYLIDQQRFIEELKSDVAAYRSQVVSATPMPNPEPTPQLDMIPKIEEIVRSKVQETVRLEIEDTIRSKVEEMVSSKFQETVRLQNEETVRSQIEETVRLKIEETVCSKINDIETDVRKYKESSTERADTIDVLVESQQQRFDNLSTEHLATSIIHQMQKLYPPHPGILQNELNVIRGKQSATEQALTVVWGEFSKLNTRLDYLTNSMSAFQRGFSEEVDRRMKDSSKTMEERMVSLNNHSNDKFLALEKRLTEMSTSSPGDPASLRKMDEAGKSSELKFQALQSLCDESKKAVDGHTGALQDIRDELAALRASSTTSISTVENNLKAAEERLQGLEDRTIREISSLHGAISALNTSTSTETETSERLSHRLSASTSEVRPGVEDSEPGSTIEPRSTKEENKSPAKPTTPSKKRKKNVYRDESTDHSYYYSSDEDGPPVRRLRTSRGSTLSQGPRVTTRQRVTSRADEEFVQLP